MKRKTILILTIIVITLLLASTVYAARKTAEPVKKPGFGRRILDSIVCLFKCGWPAWIFLLLPPIAIWFYTRFINIFG